MRKRTLSCWNWFGQHAIPMAVGAVIGSVATAVLLYGAHDLPEHAGGQSASAVSSGSSSPAVETICNDRIDNDLDTLVDCRDTIDCAYSPSCAENCTNGIDDDGDGDTDCTDLACEDDPACQ